MVERKYCRICKSKLMKLDNQDKWLCGHCHIYEVDEATEKADRDILRKIFGEDFVRTEEKVKEQEKQGL